MRAAVQNVLSRIMLAALMLPRPAFADESVAQPPENEGHLGENRTNPITVDRSSGLLDVRMHDTNIFDALEMINDATSRNIIVRNGVSGTVSVVLHKVTFDEALRAILATCDLTYEERDGIIYVQAIAKTTADAHAGQEMRIIRLNYITALEAESFLKPLLTPECTITRTTEPTPGIKSDRENAGGFSSAGSEVLIVVAPPALLKTIERAIAEIDSRPKQILVEATILRASLNDQNALGIDFNTLAGIDFQQVNANTVAVTDITNGPIPHEHLDDTSVGIRTDFRKAVPDGGFTFGIVKDHVAAFIRALEQTTDVTVMANPKVLTLNKQRGEVIVGRRDGYYTTTVTETATVQSVQYLETGTKLVFRPIASDDGFVRMEVHPEDSNGGLTAQGLPFQETTEATTNIMLRDGHTILIGGLFRERSGASKSQVPVLGSIPGLGYLFGVQQDQKTREEVIILLTVHVLSGSDNEEKFTEDAVQDIERLRVGARRGLMGTGRQQLADARYHAAVEHVRKGECDKALSDVRMCLHLDPRHIDAIHLKEKLLGERSWNFEGSQMRTYIQELLRAESGLPRKPIFERPDVDGWIERCRARESGECAPADDSMDDGRFRD